MKAHNSVIAVYDKHTDAEQAIREIQKTGFNMKNLSIIGSDYRTEEQVVGFYNTGDRMMFWGKLGAFWGGIWGLLFGSALFVIPGIGPVMVLGPLAGWIIGALEGAVVVGGLSALGAGLYSLGIPKDSIVKYETAIKSGKFLLLGIGTEEELAKVQAICESRTDVIETHKALQPVVSK